MLESPVLRNEYSRSLADADRFKALDTLTELGMLVPFDQAGYTGPTLAGNSVSDESVESRQFVSTDSDARILDASFDPRQLEPQAQQRYQDALNNLIIPITEGSPVRFQARDTAESVTAQLQSKRRWFITENDVREIAQNVDGDVAVVDQLAGSYNARQIALANPGILAGELLSAEGDITTAKVDVDGQDVDVPVNLEYVARYLQEAHIVGVKQRSPSATPGGSAVSISLFDPEKVVTIESAQQERQHIRKQLGALTSLTEIRVGVLDEHGKLPLMQALKDAHAKPEQLVADARKVPGYAEIFDSKGGNWEGFTLAEHTETVLRNFDENFADRIPVELLEPMRLAIVAHDIGKSIASANGERQKQKEYNRIQAADFFSKLGVDERTQGLLLAMIGEGQERAFALDVKKRDNATAEMRHFAEEAIRAFNGSEQADPEQVEAFETMCRILHTVDGGAYTSMAVTRRSGDAGNYRNFPSFNATFVQPTDPSKRGLKIRHGDQPVAKADLAARRTGNMPLLEKSDDVLD